MNAYAFDSLTAYEKMIASGMQEEQAKTQANLFKEFFALKADQDREELATKGAIRESELRLQKEIEIVRAEIKETELRLQKEIEIVRGQTEKVRAELKETELRLQKEIAIVRGETEKLRAELKETELRLLNEIEKTKNSLLKWQFSIALTITITLATIMAKGFGWLGF